MSQSLPRVVELIRVSTEGQEKGGTHQVQRDALDNLRRSRPGIVVQRLEALGVSGAKGMADREDLQDLMRLSKSKAYDELRVYSIDRLTRADDPRERMAIYGLVSDAGARIVDCSNRVIDPAKDGDMGEIDYFLQTLFSARERKKIAQRTVAGKKLKASQGRMVHGIPPYGRRFNKASSQWELVPGEVEIYQRIVSAYLSGETTAKIARTLNAEGVPSKRSRWGVNTINRLLTSPTIFGEYTAFGHKMQIPAITTRAEWGSIKATMAQRVVRPKATHPIDALIRGRATCAACGMQLWVLTTGAQRGQSRYGCPKPSRRVSPCPDRRTIAVQEADAHVSKALLEMVRRPEIFARALADGNAPLGDPKKALEAVEKELSKLSGREAKTLKLYNEGFLSEETAKTELGAVRGARKALSERKAAAQAAGSLVPVEDLEAHRAELAEAVKHVTPQRLRELVAIVRPAVKLGPDGLEINGELQVRYEGRRR